MTDLNGRTAIVTGGATLIGAAWSAGVHGAGATVAVADIDEAGARGITGELGDRVLFDGPTDIRDDAAIERLVAATVERFGGIDILVNLAAPIWTRVSPPHARTGSSR